MIFHRVWGRGTRAVFLFCLIVLILVSAALPQPVRGEEIDAHGGVLTSSVQKPFASCMGSDCDGKYYEQVGCPARIPGPDFTWVHQVWRDPITVGNVELSPPTHFPLIQVSLLYSKVCQAFSTSVKNLSTHPLDAGVCTFRGTLFRETNEGMGQFFCWEKGSSVVLSTQLFDAPEGRILPGETVFSPLAGISEHSEQFFWGGATVRSYIDAIAVPGGAYTYQGSVRFGTVGSFS